MAVVEAAGPCLWSLHPCMLNIDWCGKQMGFGTIFLTFRTVGVVGAGAFYKVVVWIIYTSVLWYNN